MKIIALIVNFFLPGVGTMLIGRIGTGIIQLALYGIGAFLMFTTVFWLIGAPICLVVLIWSLISALRYEEPVKTVYIERDSTS